MRPITGPVRHAGHGDRSRTGARAGCRPCSARSRSRRRGSRPTAAASHAVALQLEAADRQAVAEITAVRDEPAQAAAADASRPVVMLDGAHIRAVPGHQTRDFEAICGKVEREEQPTRRFALVRSVAGSPHALLRAALQDQGWWKDDAVTAISDGDPALPALMRSATGGPVQPILDGFHLSMRVHHVEPVMGGLCALEPPPLAPLDRAQIDVERDQGRHRAEQRRHGSKGEAPGRALHGAAGSHRKQRGRVDRLRPALPYSQRSRAGKPISPRGPRTPSASW